LKYNIHLIFFIDQTPVQSPPEFCSFRRVPEITPEQVSSSSWTNYNSSSFRNIDLNKTPDENETDFTENEGMIIT